VVDQVKTNWKKDKGQWKKKMSQFKKKVQAEDKQAKKTVKSAMSKVWGNLTSNYWSWNRRGAINKWNASENIAADGKVSLNGQKFEWFTINDDVMGG